MALFKVSLRLAHDVTHPQRRKWSTTFFVNEASPLLAADFIRTAWTGGLRSSVDESIFAYEVYATSATAGDGSYHIEPIPDGSRRGTIPVGGRGELYLSKVVAVVTLPVSGSRPSRKFWRVGAREGDIASGVDLSAGFLGLIQGAFNAFLGTADGKLVDPDGQVLGTTVGRIKLGTREYGRTAGADVPSPPAVG